MMRFIVIVVVIIGIFYFMKILLKNKSTIKKTELTGSKQVNKPAEILSDSNKSIIKKIELTSSKSTTVLPDSIIDTIKQAISGNENIEITYKNYKGISSKRCLSNINFNNDFKVEGFEDAHIKGYCHLREEERVFKINRITSIKLLK